jgi:nitroreductase
MGLRCAFWPTTTSIAERIDVTGLRLVNSRRDQMDLMDAIYTRRAVRDYKDTPLDDQTLRKLIDAAVQAPSAINEQPWSFCVVRDKALLAQTSREAKAHVLKSSPVGLLSHDFQQLLKDDKFSIFYNAPALIVISSKTHSSWATEDCALAAENLMLAACAMGLGSCWIGFAQSWLATPAGKSALKLPPTYTPLAPIIVGHTATQPLPVTRRPPEITWI